MKNKKYLDCYYEWATVGQIPFNGLCNCFIGDDLFELFIPTATENPKRFLFWAGLEGASAGGWTSGFNSLRQNIVLFMAAMNGEL